MIRFEMSLSGFRKASRKEVVLSHLESSHPSSWKKIIKFFDQKRIKVESPSNRRTSNLLGVVLSLPESCRTCPILLWTGYKGWTLCPKICGICTRPVTAAARRRAVIALFCAAAGWQVCDTIPDVGRQLFSSSPGNIKCAEVLVTWTSSALMSALVQSWPGSSHHFSGAHQWHRWEGNAVLTYFESCSAWSRLKHLCIVNESLWGEANIKT